MACFYNGFELDAKFVSFALSKYLDIIALKTKKKFSVVKTSVFRLFSKQLIWLPKQDKNGNCIKNVC